MSIPSALEVQGVPPYGAAEVERPLQISPLFVATTCLLLVISAGLYYAGLMRALAVLWGLWTFGVVMASPRAGIILSLATQVFDVALNPEVGSQWQAISPGRMILLLTVVSYLARVAFGHRPSLRATRGTVWMIVLFLAWCTVSLMWSTHYGLTLMCVGKLSVQLVVLIAAVDLLADRRAIQQTILLLGVGGAAGGLVTLFGGVALRSGADIRMSLQGIGINSFAISVGLGGVAMAALVAQRRTPVVFVSSVVIVILTTLVALRTGTRSVIVGAPLAAAAGAAVGYWRKLHKLILLTGLVAVLSGGTLLWAVRVDFIQGKLRDRVLTVFTEQTYETNTRWQLWEQAMDIYLRRPIGYGAGHESFAFKRHA
ncbi:MAG: O-antigen ligase family protein, partial [Planctomycetes bacterium]|nr:O-antigen ligase family protein [Planctomycetota bacterium]